MDHLRHPNLWTMSADLRAVSAGTEGCLWPLVSAVLSPRGETVFSLPSWMNRAAGSYPLRIHRKRRCGSEIKIKNWLPNKMKVLAFPHLPKAARASPRASWVGWMPASPTEAVLPAPCFRRRVWETALF